MSWMKEKPLAFAVVCALSVFVVLVLADITSQKVLSAISAPKRSGLYGIFLSNGQVYFGNITKEDDRKLMLQNIFYIQTKSTDPAQAMQDPNGVSLLKLGNEFHGPEDSMEINQQNILFIEKLKADGKVAKAISSYQQK